MGILDNESAVKNIASIAYDNIEKDTELAKAIEFSDSETTANIKRMNQASDNAAKAVRIYNRMKPYKEAAEKGKIEKDWLGRDVYILNWDSFSVKWLEALKEDMEATGYTFEGISEKVPSIERSWFFLNKETKDRANKWATDNPEKKTPEPEEEVVNIISKDAEADNNKEEKKEDNDKTLHSGAIKPINTNKSDEDKKKAAAVFSKEWYDKLTSNKFNKSKMVQNNKAWSEQPLATKLKAYLTNLNAEKIRKNKEEAGSASKDKDFMEQIAASTAEAKREFGDDFASEIIKNLNN